MVISIIVAMAKNRVIGCNGQLPWRLPSDLNRFRELTIGHVLLMGRQTYESIGKPLDGRRTIILSRNRDYSASGCMVAADLEDALKLAADAEHVFICGGEDIYSQSLNLADQIYLTELVDIFDGDRFFPELPEGRFQISQREKVIDCHDYYFTLLQRQRA
jgi:dihydrofolate reductase